MDRERLEDLLTGLLDDELTPAERAELDQELEASEEARALLESYRSQSEGLQALGPMTVPAGVKDATKSRIASEPVPLKPSASTNFLWLIGTMAACFAFFWASAAVRGPVSEGKLYLAHGALHVNSPGQTHQLYLKSGADEVHVLHSQDLGGTLTNGSARAILECDAGETQGQALKLKLSLDLDGDNEFDVVQESEVFEFDSEHGYEVLTADFPPISDEHSGQKVRGRARLELVGQSLNENGLAVQFHPERAQLILPMEKGRVI
jgi:hypothetical protein